MKPVSRVDYLETGISEPVQNGGTNAEALTKYGNQNLIQKYIFFSQQMTNIFYI